MRSHYLRALPCTFAVLSLFFFLSPTRAQTVRYEEPSGSVARTGNRAAEEQNRHDWVDLREGETGTRVVLSGDLRNADVTIFTNIGFGIDPLLNESRQIVRKLDRPKTDFIVRKGRKTTHAVDLEFNDYVERNERQSSSFALNLATLRDALEASSLPRPITLFVEHKAEDITVATLHVPGKPSRRLTESFFSLREVPNNATLRYQTTVPWYGYIVAFALFGVTMVMMPYAEWTAFQSRRKERAKRRANATPLDTVPDPATVQEQYNKQKPMWVYMLMPGVFTVGIAVLMAGGGLQKGVSAGMTVLQALDLPIVLLPFAMMGILGISKGIGLLAEKNEIKREGEPVLPRHLDEDNVPTWTAFGFFYPMMGAMLAMMPLVAFPAFRGTLLSLAPNAVWYYYGGVIAVAVTAAVYIGIRARQLTHYPLPNDHYAHGIIAELAGDLAVRVRKVEVARSASLNAYVTIWRTMGFTSRLLREFSPEELRVVIAHEVGHFRAADPPRHALIRLLITAAFLGIWVFGTNYLRSHYHLSTGTLALLNSPLFSIVLLPILQSLFSGKASRRAEEAADRFAVDACRGDGELVIRTLTKLHTLNASPHQLKPSDEVLSTHPSLANRVAAIRCYTGEEQR